ncbi:MAG: type II toxin-antitoxin system VapC family toxin [Alphaproteobacteria bacterium]
MTVFCLDTNIAIAIIDRQSEPLRARLKSELSRRTAVQIPSIVVFELHYGAAKSQHWSKSQAKLQAFLDQHVSIIPFTDEDAAEAGQIRADLDKAGTPIGPYDLLIAAQARRRAATVVTINRREFDRIPSLKVTDWSD